MSDRGPKNVEYPERGKKSSHPFFWIGHDAFDLYVPIMGPDCFTVYSYFARRYHSDPTLKHDIRSLAQSCGMSPSTALRACEVLEHLRLLKLRRFRGSRQSECQLFDSGAAAERLGAKYDPEMKSYRFPAQVSERLHSEIHGIRERQQGHAKGAKAATILCGNLPLRVSRRNTSVSPEKRQRATRETQAGTHVIRKEKRSERTPTPTPTPSDSGRPQTEETDSDKDEPGGLLRWARMRFTGVINDMRNHLLDTNVPPIPRLQNGYQDWNESGFGHMAIEGAKFHGGVLALAISAPDPAAARWGLEKYRRTWDESIRRWFEGDVRVELMKA